MTGRTRAVTRTAVAVCLVAMPWAARGAVAPASRTAAPVAAKAATPAASHVRESTLGSSTMELNGPWKFHTGDNPAWAKPGFNDSGWDKADLTPPKGSYDPFLGTGGHVPGWTMRGYPGYWGFAWYRLTLNLKRNEKTTAGSGFALKMPDNVDDAYQVFVNGKMVGEFGRFKKSGVTSYLTLPRAFTLPASITEGPVTIAIRVWMAPDTRLINPDTGGLHGPPVLGLAAPVEAMLRLDWATIDRSQMSHFAELAVVMLALLVVLLLYWLDQRERAYFWLALTLSAIALQNAIGLIGNYQTWIPASVSLLVMDAMLLPAQIALWVMFWSTWFRLGHMKRLRWMVWSMAALWTISVLMQRAPLYGTVVPLGASVVLLPLMLMLKLLLGGLLVWVTWEGIRKDAAGGWLALPAVALVFASVYQQNMLLLHIPLTYFPFGYAVSIGQIGVVASLNIITVLLMRRFLRSLQKREHLQQEVAQAREVQQLLIPEAIPTIPGFVLESEYRPALQVGGDFFQILPDGSGGVLAVLGDVTGKGLQAGMLVALIVGSIRTIVETSYEPVYVLGALNRLLCGRGRAFATCVAIHVTENGDTVIANAGHLSPYLNRNEVCAEGNFPLGMAEIATYDPVHVTLQPGDRLTVVTDGVVEARSPSGELFGFNHARAISHLPAAFIARAAQLFGQDDDITVLSICRETAGGSQRVEPIPFPIWPAEA